MNRAVHTISGRLSLRPPQRKSLEILHRAMEIAHPREERDPSEVLAAIRVEFSKVEDFERSFPSLCFALATGVGKTRLMGAFIAYLHHEHGVRNFFVLAPNLTIYEKLLSDFSPSSPKYVLQGIAEFAVKSPMLVTGENFEERPQVMHLFERDDVVINIFNIAKFNVRAKDARKAWRLSEYLGQSYFEHLAEQDDLVLLMDESHRYRGDAAMQSIEDLRPMLGLELTATPQVESSGGPTRFRNVIYEYPLSKAMQDGFVKEPAVATRRDFKAANMSKEQLERLKLEDGIRVHEDAKVSLDVYARERGERPVKPFMLVIASDTEHANRLVTDIESNDFFDGRYRGRVIQVHSSQSKSEKDENVARLLAVERPDEPTEIVVHVNMLKEGWDVTNLYTIVPLRAADSRTLVEQSIGRGLRLPYGQRTGVPAVDRLTIVAHDRFQDIVDEARKGGYSFSVVNIGEEVPEKPKQSVVVPPVFESILTGPEATEGEGEPPAPPEGEPTVRPRFQTAEDVAAARFALEAIRRVTRDARIAPGATALESLEVQNRLVADVTKALSFGAPTLFPAIDPDRLASVVRETTAVYLNHTIAIPRVIVLPQGDVRAGFDKFKLDLSAVRYPPVPHQILVQSLTTDAQEIIGESERALVQEARLEDYLVRGLIDFDDVNYDEQADLLYDLASQVVAHLRSYLADDGEVRNVLLFHQRQLANLIHGQMQQHAWEEATSYDVQVSAGFTEVRPQAFAADGNEQVRRYDAPIENKSEIRRMLFGGFEKCLYATQKFDVDPERRFAVILERDGTVLKWFKPGRAVLQIHYAPDSDYEPDFVVETSTRKFLCETKRADHMKDPIVLAKAKSAATWCRHASEHEAQHDGKPWSYLLIPHDSVDENMTLDGLASGHEFDGPPGDDGE